MTGPLTDAEKQARSRAARVAEGGKVITTVLSPEAARKLEAWRAKHGLSTPEVLHKLLVRSKP